MKNKIADSIFDIACGYVIFVAAAGFLFGQLFFAHFDIPATVVGVCGVLAGSLCLIQKRIHIVPNVIINLFSVGALAGVCMDAYGYYANYHSPGNYYAWFMIGPFCVAVVLVAYMANRKRKGDV